MQTKTLTLLQAKIAELRTALFFCDNPHDLSYAAHIVEVEEMDAQGCIWFQVNNHGRLGVQPGELFPVSLGFYRKGIPYTIDIKGMASVETIQGNQLLLKVAVGRLQYKSFTDSTPVPVIETIGKVFRNVFDIAEPMDEFAVVE